MSKPFKLVLTEVPEKGEMSIEFSGSSQSLAIAVSGFLKAYPDYAEAVAVAVLESKVLEANHAGNQLINQLNKNN